MYKMAKKITEISEVPGLIKAIPEKIHDLIDIIPKIMEEYDFELEGPKKDVDITGVIDTTNKIYDGFIEAENTKYYLSFCFNKKLK